LREAPYALCYPATVQRSLADGSVEVLTDDAAMRALGAVAVPCPGVPDTSIRAALGQRCLLAFRAADPSRPYIAEWEGGQRGNRVGFRQGFRRVARLGDAITITMSPALQVNGTVEGTVTVPGTPPVTVPLPPTPFFGVLVLAPAPTAVVQTGNPKLLA
jgi:hypothetical protein